MKVSLRSKQVGLWGYVVLLDVEREKDDSKEGSIIHQVKVVTEEIDCASEKKEKVEKFCWELTEDYGSGEKIVEMIIMLGLGTLYKDYERIVQTVSGEWWVQKVKDGAAVKTGKNTIVDIPSTQSAPKKSDKDAGRVKDGDVEITLPNILDGSENGVAAAKKADRLHGKLEGDALTKKQAYVIEYSWKKCEPPGGDVTFALK